MGTVLKPKCATCSEPTLCRPHSSGLHFCELHEPKPPHTCNDDGGWIEFEFDGCRGGSRSCSVCGRTTFARHYREF